METLRFEDKMYIKHTLKPYLFETIPFTEVMLELSKVLNKMPDRVLLTYLFTTLR